MKKFLSLVLAIVIMVCAVPLGTFAFTASEIEYTSGYYTYTVSNGEATITKTSYSISGYVTVPSMLGGYPVKRIGDCAFEDSDIISINISEGIESIGAYAFEECINLINVYLPKGLVTIGENAFLLCESLTKINIPASVTNIGSGAFGVCRNLKDISVDENNQYFCSVDGVLFDKSKSLLLSYPAAKSKSSFTIPKSVVSIVDYAFACCRSLETIEIPNSVISIGNYAFAQCEKLTSIIIPNSVMSIGECAFAYCLKLKNISVDKKNQYFCSIDGVLFDKSKSSLLYCPASKTAKSFVIPDSVVSISEYAFSDCDRLTTITIPKSVIGIENGAFSGCDNLKKVYYRGSETDKQKITIGYNYDLTDVARWYYNSCINSKSHTYKTTALTKATPKKSGSITQKCTVCEKKSKSTIKYAKTFKLSTTSYTYNGKVKTPSVVVKDSAGKTLKKNTDYTVSYASGRKNAGTYKVTVKMKGNYSGSKTLTFKINPAKLGSCKLSATTYTYSGKNKTPSVTVKNAAGTKLTKNKDYTLSVKSTRKNVGTYTVTIKGKGNYTGTKKLTFKILPVKTTVSKLTAGKKSITVNIAKKSTQVTGYQVQYSTSKKFTTAKTKTISSYKTTKYNLKSLSAKKTYYVRVRTYKTVSGKKYYSSWSTAKKVKTK